MYPALHHGTYEVLLILYMKPLCRASTHIVFAGFRFGFFAGEEFEIQGGCDLPKDRGRTKD